MARTQPYKGARDFYPDDKRLQTWMFSVMRETVERYGYEEYDAPVLEPTELYTLKGSQEIISEQSYTFTDRGDRSVTMRTEMTPSVSRMVAARRQELVYPLRWYSIPNLWRYERPQRGRLREFCQLNVDVFGVDNETADCEIIEVADALMQAFGAQRDMYTIRLNSRVFMDYVLNEYIGLSEVESGTIRRLIDKMHKMDFVEFGVGVEAAMNPTQREDGSPERLLKILSARSFEELPLEMNDHPSLASLKNILNELHDSGVSNALFDPTLMRGFDYYTDVVFEVFDVSPENNRSMFGGGRYDGLVGLFGVEPVPTVGFGMGDVTLEIFLREHDLIPRLDRSAQLTVLFIGDDTYKKSKKALRLLRDEGVNVFADITQRKTAKQLEAAVKRGDRFVLIIGEEELANEQYTLRDLKNSSEEKHSLERIISFVLAK